MDGSSVNMNLLKKNSFFWKHDLHAETAFITKEDINLLLSKGMLDWEGVDILHIDVDGNDYWIWKGIEVNPAV